MLKKIQYKELNSRQQENFNYQKVAAVLADYGFNCMRLNDDWQGADFIACHIDGNTFMKVQLKGRLTIEKKYNGKDIYIAFNQKGQWYLYPHDNLEQIVLANFPKIRSTKSYAGDNGGYNWPTIPQRFIGNMKAYAI
jgi:hypothetical protein